MTDSPPAPHHETCETCGGPISRNMFNVGDERWLHARPADWLTNPHRAVPVRS